MFCEMIFITWYFELKSNASDLILTPLIGFIFTDYWKSYGLNRSTVSGAVGHAQ